MTNGGKNTFFSLEWISTASAIAENGFSTSQTRNALAKICESVACRVSPNGTERLDVSAASVRDRLSRAATIDAAKSHRVTYAPARSTEKQRE